MAAKATNLRVWPDAAKCANFSAMYNRAAGNVCITAKRCVHNAGCPMQPIPFGKANSLGCETTIGCTESSQTPLENKSLPCTPQYPLNHVFTVRKTMVEAATIALALRIPLRATRCGKEPLIVRKYFLCAV